MTGWRLGYTAANKEVINAMGRVQVMPYLIPAPLPNMLISSFRGEGLTNKMIVEYDRRRYIWSQTKGMRDLGLFIQKGPLYICGYL